MSDTDEFRFLAGAGDLSGDERISLLAGCIANQQRAGFRDAIDIREAHCPHCDAPGFNTGWGFYRFTCGLEVLSDGEESSGCGRATIAEGGKP